LGTPGGVRTQLNPAPEPSIYRDKCGEVTVASLLERNPLPMASWFETRGVAALLTMRVKTSS
jgi:hypothetical protein